MLVTTLRGNPPKRHLSWNQTNQANFYKMGSPHLKRQINRLGEPAISNAYSLGTSGWRQYWSALMLVTILPWYSTNTSTFLEAIKTSKKGSQIADSKMSCFRMYLSSLQNCKHLFQRRAVFSHHKCRPSSGSNTRLCKSSWASYGKLSTSLAV